MRIALVSDWFLPRTGGLELQVRDLGVQLVRRGHEVEIITATPGESLVDGIKIHRVDVGPLLPRFFFRGQERHELEPLHLWRLLGEWKRCWNRWLSEPLERLLREGRFDVVHGHSAYSPLALTACRLARQADIPSVLTEHSVSKGLGNVLLSLAERTWHWSAWPDVIAGVSSYIAEEMKAQTGRDVEILPNGIDPAEWTIQRKTGPAWVVSVMRLTPRKRGIDFVRSIPHVTRQLGWQMPPRFLLIGDGPERARIEREAIRLGVADQLELPGRLERNEVRELLAQSTLFALPTLKEALSIAVLEALSAGLPIVAMNHGGVGDIVRHHREGFLAGSHQEFCDYIAQLLSDEDLRREMASRAHESVMRFSWDVVIKKHIDTYERARAFRRNGFVLQHAS